MCIVFLLFACLERVTGEAVPLDEGFYAAAEANRASPDGGEGGGGTPFSGFSGTKVRIKGILISSAPLPVDIDLRTPDSSAPGGMARQGKVMLEAPGEFEIMVPVNIGTVELQAFQDLDGDGPNGEDPFGDLRVDVEESDLTGLTIELKEGGHAEHMQQTQSPQQPSGAGQQENPDPFGSFPGARISLKGTMRCEIDCALVDLDVFQPDDQSPGGRKMLGKVKIPPGEYVLEVPINFGPLILEAFVDFDNDGPGIGDLMGRYEGNPVQILSSAVSNIDINLAASTNGKMPMGEQPPPPPDQPPPPSDQPPPSE